MMYEEINTITFLNPTYSSNLLMIQKSGVNIRLKI